MRKNTPAYFTGCSRGFCFLSFVSFQFLLFFLIVTLVYFLLPNKYRWLWLLAVSYFFYMCFSPQYAVLLAASTLVTYLSGILIGKENKSTESVKAKKNKKLIIALSFIINLGILAVFKYLNFFSEIFAGIASALGAQAAPVKFDIILPAGISFYTFQALSYTVDVYRGDIEPEKHFGKYALFVSFFPQLVAGPIQKSKNLLPQFSEEHHFDYDNARGGLLLMLWGYFQKMVVADRLAVFVNSVYNAPAKHFGFEVMIANIFFAFQIYCDFAGYSNIAIGAAQVMGFKLSKNFDKPYMSKSVKEFWRRWHITLGAWFRDYLYIPLGGNRCSQFRHCLNIVIVFAVCGLWHGASMTFVVWGALHGLYQVIGILTKPAKERAEKSLKINMGSKAVGLYQTAATFILVDFAWIFFRADTFEDAFTVIGNMFIFGKSVFPVDYIFEMCLIVFVVLIDALRKKHDFRGSLLKKNLLCRWAVYVTSVLVILIIGVYGSQAGAQQFIYFQF